VFHSLDKVPASKIRKTDRVKIVQLGDRWWTWMRLSADNRIVGKTYGSWRRREEAEKNARTANLGCPIDGSTLD